MKKSAAFLTSAVLLVLSSLAGAPAARAQSVSVSPVPFDRFIVSNVDLGVLLTANHSEGVNANFLYYPFPQAVGIVEPPAAGWTPTPGQGLIPLYRWKVHQGNRWYYYFSGFYSTQGNGYTYEGVAGYVLPPNGAYGGVNLVIDYSQVRGFYFRLQNESIPGNAGNQFGFNTQGVVCNLPLGGTFSFDPPPPPPPPPTCEPSNFEVYFCERNGGWFDYTECTCHGFIEQ